MATWVRKGLAGSDLTHPSPQGGEILGDLFYKALTSGLRGVGRARAARRPPPTEGLLSGSGTSRVARGSAAQVALSAGAGDRLRRSTRCVRARVPQRSSSPSTLSASARPSPKASTVCATPRYRPVRVTRHLRVVRAGLVSLLVDRVREPREVGPEVRAQPVGADRRRIVQDPGERIGKVSGRRVLEEMR